MFQDFLGVREAWRILVEDRGRMRRSYGLRAHDEVAGNGFRFCAHISIDVRKSENAADLDRTCPFCPCAAANTTNP